MQSLRSRGSGLRKNPARISPTWTKMDTVDIIGGCGSSSARVASRPPSSIATATISAQLLNLFTPKWRLSLRRLPDIQCKSLDTSGQELRA